MIVILYFYSSKIVNVRLVTEYFVTVVLLHTLKYKVCVLLPPVAVFAGILGYMFLITVVGQ